MAQLKHIFRGESLTVLLTFPEAYDMARIEKHEIYIGATAFTGVVRDQTIELKITSEQTDVMYGKQEIRLWLDDAILGVKKPYCGDIIVSNSNAKPANDSTSSVSDIIIPIVISETAVTVGDILYNYVKGDKGDPFTYSDFTPEQIAELQQPAADAIASIGAVELAVETAEGLRQQAEQSRQTNTATAIQNAETATTNAGNAASLANEKAGLANNAATLANTKAGLADTAATNANTKAGLADAAATNANNVANGYAAELAAKVAKTDIATQVEAEANTENTKFMTALRVFQNFVKNATTYVFSTLNTTSKTITGAINELKGQTPAATTLQTVTDKNQYYPIAQNNAGTVIGRHIVRFWNGASWLNASAVALGDSAAQNASPLGSVAIGYQAGTNMTANGVAIGYQSGTNISDQIAIGYRAMNNFTGAYATAVGHESAKIGTNAHYTTAFGAYSQSNNCAGSSCSFGSSSLLNNTGTYSNGIGVSSLLNNTGGYANGIGVNTLKYNQKDNNTAIGDNSYSGFLENIAGNKTANSSAVDITLERIKLTAHGFGAVNAIVNIKYASTDGTAIGGLTVGTVYQVKIIDANTVEFISGSQKINLTSQGTGNHTFTPQFAYTNTTCLGANTQPNRDNQVVLGSTAVDTVKIGGTARTIASATATGEKGEMCWDANYIYICVATNTWKRTALSTW